MIDSGASQRANLARCDIHRLNIIALIKMKNTECLGRTKLSFCANSNTFYRSTSYRFTFF